jgi:hypothetical protein
MLAKKAARFENRRHVRFMKTIFLVMIHLQQLVQDPRKQLYSVLINSYCLNFPQRQQLRQQLPSQVRRK